MQKKSDAVFIVPISSEELGERFKTMSIAHRAYIAGTGSALDDIAYALGMWTWEDCESNNFEHLDECIEQTIKDFSFEDHTRDQMNGDDKLNGLPVIAHSEFLAGDWYELNEPDTFQNKVTESRRTILEAVRDMDEANIPPKLLEAINEARDSFYDDLRHEWLYGDRSSEGLLSRLSLHFTGERGHVGQWTQGEDKTLIEFTEDQARECMGYAIEDSEAVTMEKIKDYLLDHICNKAEERIIKYSRDQESRKAAHELTAKRVEEAHARKIEEAKARKAAKLTP